MQCCVTLSTSLIPKLPFWHLHWLVFVQSVDNLDSQMLEVLRYISHGDATAFVKTQQCPYDINQESVLCNSTQQYQPLLEQQVSRACNSIGQCIFHYHLITTWCCHTQCAVHLTMHAIVMTNNSHEKCLTLFMVTGVSKSKCI